MELIILLWYFCNIIQTILSYGTAYRLTKKGGDNGIALFGWFIVCGIAALIPGLGFYLWVKNKEE